MKTKTNPTDLAFSAEQEITREPYETARLLTGGLTKREYFAGIALQSVITKIAGYDGKYIALISLSLADALIEALNETE